MDTLVGTVDKKHPSPESSHLPKTINLWTKPLKDGRVKMLVAERNEAGQYKSFCPFCESRYREFLADLPTMTGKCLVPYCHQTCELTREPPQVEISPKNEAKPSEVHEQIKAEASKTPVKKAGSPPGTDKAPASNERESLTEAEGELFSDGWIKLFRKIERSEVFQNEGLLKVWIWCLIRANHQNHWIPMKRGKGTTKVFVRRGQFIFGRESASKALKMPESTVQDRIVKLQSNRYIDIKSDTYYSTITVCNYEKYQSNEGVQVTGKEGEKVTDKENPKATGKQQISNTYKNEKNKKHYVEGSDELRLASFLLEEIRKNKPNYREPNLQAWARDIDLLLRRDNRSAETIERVVRWAQADHGDGMGKWKGWAAVILSAEKLRDKFDELELKMNETPPTEKKKSW